MQPREGFRRPCFSHKGWHISNATSEIPTIPFSAFCSLFKRFSLPYQGPADFNTSGPPVGKPQQCLHIQCFTGLEGSVRPGTSASLMLQGTTSNSTDAPNHLKRSLRAASSKRDLCISEGCKSSQCSTCCTHESVVESRPQIFANYQSTLIRRAPGLISQHHLTLGWG
jgi:hypothetical protein